jgi:pimeloyl-ACP methyl ester carboxylesterase
LEKTHHSSAASLATAMSSWHFNSFVTLILQL